MQSSTANHDCKRACFHSVLPSLRLLLLLLCSRWEFLDSSWCLWTFGGPQILPSTCKSQEWRCSIWISSLWSLERGHKNLQGNFSKRVKQIFVDKFQCDTRIPILSLIEITYAEIIVLPHSAHLLLLVKNGT